MNYESKSKIYHQKTIKMKAKQSIKKPKEQPKMAYGVTHADRKRWWTNYNAILINRISEIKNANA